MDILLLSHHYIVTLREMYVVFLQTAHIKRHDACKRIPFAWPMAYFIGDYYAEKTDIFIKATVMMKLTLLIYM